ncbi:secreted protein, putative [Ixodes scapularis]|uniref:Secreted protein, putative n=1 Tax=Ixodes scapularis TaxID=6945 RepID=B7QJT2_IXOSC|nr:secreted protein, putative [Ixodes scapularis]|eukprot:XP_002415439.1 secreted protein, putative [Ixodes scapularis]
MLLVFFACPIHRSESSTPSNPTKQFFDDIQTRPVLTYQCYQSGNSIDAPGSVNYTILWYGIDKNTDAFFGQTWSAINGTPDSYTRGQLTGNYDESSSVGKLETDSKALYLKIVQTSPGDTEVTKIYDVNFKCKNAKKLLSTVCPDPCNLELTRELSNE